MEEKNLQDEVDKEWAENKKTFQKMLPDLLKKEEYNGKYVVIYEGKIVGVDEDKIKLIKEAYEKYGYNVMYCGKVSEELEVKEISSPELA